MDARDYFEQIVKPNYYEAKDNPNDLRSVWNAILTMNTVAESIALERLDYSSVDRDIRHSGHISVSSRPTKLHRCNEACAQANARRHRDFYKHSSN
jgi:hypothetical protein